jgi:pseudaminic acid synthase
MRSSVKEAFEFGSEETLGLAMKIGTRMIGRGHPCYMVAELSANHGHDFDQAVRTIRAMKEAGADAVKIQTYTPATMTIECDEPPFIVGGGTLWDGRTLHDLYKDAYTPWEWQPALQNVAHEVGLDFFSTPFDATAVEFLEKMDVPVHKVASFELVDIPLLKRVAATGKPVIISTGMATLEEIEEAIATLRGAKSGPLILLKCTSAYPAPPSEMNLRTMVDMGERFGVPVGLSDHTLDHNSSVAAVALGACLVEKHFVLSRTLPGPDSAFSLEPQEFRAMVDAVRTVEQAMGTVRYHPVSREQSSMVFRRSIFVVEDMREGEPFTARNVRVIRPGFGMHPRHYEEVQGCMAAADIKRGTPLSWNLVRPDSAS